MWLTLLLVMMHRLQSKVMILSGICLFTFSLWQLILSHRFVSQLPLLWPCYKWNMTPATLLLALLLHVTDASAVCSRIVDLSEEVLISKKVKQWLGLWTSIVTTGTCNLLVIKWKNEMHFWSKQSVHALTTLKHQHASWSPINTVSVQKKTLLSACINSSWNFNPKKNTMWACFVYVSTWTVQ